MSREEEYIKFNTPNETKLKEELDKANNEKFKYYAMGWDDCKIYMMDAINDFVKEQLTRKQK